MCERVEASTGMEMGVQTCTLWAGCKHVIGCYMCAFVQHGCLVYLGVSIGKILDGWVQCKGEGGRYSSW